MKLRISRQSEEAMVWSIRFANFFNRLYVRISFVKLCAHYAKFAVLKMKTMMRLFFSLMLILSTFSLISQSNVAIATDDWQHTAGDGSGASLTGTDTIFANTDIFQVGEIKVTLKNQSKDNIAQEVILEVIYDDFTKEQLLLEISKGKRNGTFRNKLKHNDIRNVAVVRLYGADGQAHVEVGEVSLSKTGRLKNLDDADKSKVKYRPGPFEKYGVIRATYPMAKPPFFMGINSKQVSLEAYAIPGELGEEATATLKVTCIDSDKAWREEFVFELTEQPDTYSFTLDENLETEYEGYFMIFMPAPRSNDIAIRMVQME
jgi:hypothetical protein